MNPSSEKMKSIKIQQTLYLSKKTRNKTYCVFVGDHSKQIVPEDPRWNESTYVLGNYKTEPCKKPPRLCRQGYACPQYHNNRDRRRSPHKYKYRSTPCPNVKHGDEWGDPCSCENGDSCSYCHTRTEQVMFISSRQLRICSVPI